MHRLFATKSGLATLLCSLWFLLPAGGLASSSFRPVPGAVSNESFQFKDTRYLFSAFTPSGFTAGVQLPTLLLIHGAGGKGLDILGLWKSFAERQGIILIAPDLPLDAVFETTVPELFPALMDAVEQNWHSDPRRTYVFGYSAGGYITFDAAILSSDRFAAAGVFAAIISPDYEDIVARAKRRTPIAIYMGDHDQFFRVTQSRRTRDLLQASHFPVHYVELPGVDHNYGAVSSTVNADVWKFMSHYSLP